jgi:hypothetical protein
MRAAPCVPRARHAARTHAAARGEPRWYTVRNMHGALLESRHLAAGSDMKRAFVAAMLAWIDAGWQLGEFSSTGGVFFCARGADRRMVSITPTDPGQLTGYGAAHLVDSPIRPCR